MITTVTLVGQSPEAQRGDQHTSMQVIGCDPVPYVQLGDTKVFPAAAVHATASGSDGDDKIAIWWGMYKACDDVGDLADMLANLDVWDMKHHKQQRV